jgi:hypothetical protein
MAELTKRSPLRLETIDGLRTLWEYDVPTPNKDGGTRIEKLLLCFLALREEDAKKVDCLDIQLLGRTYHKAEMVVVHEKGFKVIKRVWVTDGLIDL